MRKFITAIMAVAMLAIPAAASANGTDNSVSLPSQAGTMTVALDVPAYPDVHLVHTFDVKVNPCDGTFTGTGTRNIGDIQESVTGSINDGKVAFEATYTGSQEHGYTWGVSNGVGHDSTGTAFTASITKNLTNGAAVKCDSAFISMAEIRNTLNIGVLEAQWLAASHTAKFTVEQPRDTVGQYESIWKHVYTVVVGPDGSFKGTGTITNGVSDDTAWTESITGKFGVNTVSFKTVPSAGATFEVKNAAYGSSVVAASPYSGVVEMKSSKPVTTGDAIVFTANGRTLPVNDVTLFGATLGYNVGGFTKKSDVQINGVSIKSSRLAELIAQWKASH